MIDLLQRRREMVGGGAQPTPPIPPEYTEEEYINISGPSKYIETDFVPTAGCRVEIKFQGMVTTSAKAGCYFGSRNGYNNNVFSYQSSLSSGSAPDMTINAGFSTQRSLTIPNVAGDVTIYGVDGGRFYYNDTTIATYTDTFSPTYPIYIMRVNSAGSPYINAARGDLYYCKCWDDQGELVRDYKPVTRIADSAKGLYDVVTQTFEILK